MSVNHTQTTTDPGRIRDWAEARSARPARVVGTGDDPETSRLRLRLPYYFGEDPLEEIHWDEFFEAFERQGLALELQERREDGTPSTYHRLVSRAQARAPV